MPEKYRSYERESVKQKFVDTFGPMLETDEVLKLVGKEEFERLSTEDKLIQVAVGENKPVFPAFQFDATGFKHDITEVIGVIANASSTADRNFFPWPIQFLEWWYGLEKIPFFKNDRATPLELLTAGNKDELLARAKEYGEKRIPVSFKRP